MGTDCGIKRSNRRPRTRSEIDFDMPFEEAFESVREGDERTRTSRQVPSRLVDNPRAAQSAVSQGQRQVQVESAHGGRGGAVTDMRPEVRSAFGDDHAVDERANLLAFPAVRIVDPTRQTQAADPPRLAALLLGGGRRGRERDANWTAHEIAPIRQPNLGPARRLRDRRVDGEHEAVTAIAKASRAQFVVVKIGASDLGWVSVQEKFDDKSNVKVRRVQDKSADLPLRNERRLRSQQPHGRLSRRHRSHRCHCAAFR